MKRAFSLLLLFGALLALAGCPVQHYAVVSWHPGAVYAATVQYRVYRSQLPASSFVVQATEPQAITSFIDLGVVSGQTYYYRITAYDTSSARESSPSLTVSTVIP